ncbi:ABC transporter substrate-binding protein [Microbacterium sp. ASV81]|uniref:ABC transporter substrate-binding protein n=1 Tax=Microbacterium capsulatum TaxID=3041921 RepID=A0ABU0XJ82_9MICO|nr:ABC transporter substrate-binding protein [Microbacterium sp. ASV81]MDQ4215200.1 ABC transporter substrate-binding protein [Microbacterium sp. ASV81]
MNKRGIVAVAAAGALALGLAGCSGGATATGGSSTAGASNGTPETVKIMVGGIDKQIYLPYKLADQLGFYKKFGVNVELSTEQDGGVGAEDAMISGQVDFAGAWYNHAIELQPKGKEVIDVVQLSGAPGERLMCTDKSGVKSAADIKGKNMGVTDLGSGTDKLTQFIAHQAGLKPTDYHTVAVHAGATAIAALQQGTADCAMTTQPTVTALTTQNVASTTVDLATTEGAKKALGGAWPAAGLLGRSEWVNAHKDATQRVVNALVATMHWINEHSAADIADKLPADYVNNKTITKDQYVAGLTTDKGQFLPDGIMPAGGPKTILDMEKQLGLDTSKVDLSKTFTNDYAQKANKDAGTKVTTTAAGSDG